MLQLHTVALKQPSGQPAPPGEDLSPKPCKKKGRDPRAVTPFTMLRMQCALFGTSQWGDLLRELRSCISDPARQMRHPHTPPTHTLLQPVSDLTPCTWRRVPTLHRWVMGNQDRLYEIMCAGARPDAHTAFEEMVVLPISETVSDL